MRETKGHRKLTGKRLVVASHNPGKLREIAELLAPLRIETISAAELGLAEPEETGATFQENAELKARAASGASGLPAIADDSGLCIDALGGAPGTRSARWAGPTKDFRAAMARVERELADVPLAERTAHFVCALSLAWPDGHAETFIGRIDGQLAFPPRGEMGFGYDPIFIAAGEHLTFGEMDPARKHAMSHRARAFAKLIAVCFDAR
jgi:XTP/dITP diphosphohydrolase